MEEKWIVLIIYFIIILVIVGLPTLMTVLWFEIFESLIHETGHALIASIFDNKQNISVSMIKRKNKKCIIFKVRNIVYEINSLTSKCGGVTDFEDIDSYNKKQIRIIGSAGIVFGTCGCLIYNLLISSIIYYLVFYNKFYFYFYIGIGLSEYFILLIVNIVKAIKRFKRDNDNWQNDIIAILYPKLYQERYTKQKAKD